MSEQELLTPLQELKQDVDVPTVDKDGNIVIAGRQYHVEPEVLTYADVCGMIPFFCGKKGLVDGIFRFLKIDKVNEVHSRWHATPGIPFAHALVEKEFKVRVRVDNEEVLSRFPTGAFITVSNHPLGAFDGILLLHEVGTFRTDYRVMVNLFLNHLSAMSPSFIPVDPSGSDDPAKKKVTLEGIREAIAHVRNGHPLGFFPAGAVSKVKRDLHIRDRQWQPSIIKLISQLKVPVIPIYFHGHNSTFFNILGIISWQLRTLRLPAEVFRMRGRKVHLSIGEPIMPEEQKACANIEELGKLLRDRTYALEKIK